MGFDKLPSDVYRCDIAKTNCLYTLTTNLPTYTGNMQRIVVHKIYTSIHPYIIASIYYTMDMYMYGKRKEFSNVW